MMKSIFYSLLLIFTLNHGALAAPTGPVNTIWRMPSSGFIPAFGSINLATSAAVGTSVLPYANGGSNYATLDQSYELRNLGLSATASSNVLTVTLTQKDGSTAPTATAPVLIGTRGTSAATGLYNQTAVTATATITLAAGDSIGVSASIAQTVYVYFVQDGTSEICLSNWLLNEGILQSATALTGGAEITAGVLYCTTAHTSRPIRLIGSLIAAWANPNWGSLTDISLVPFVRSLQYANFTSTGSWTAPKGIWNAIVCGCGGGGGGGGATTLATGSSGMGGGGAGWGCQGTPVTQNTAYTTTVGGGGTGGNGGGATGNSGNDGTDSSFGSLITFKAGRGGVGGSVTSQALVTTYATFGNGAGSGGHGGIGKTGANTFSISEYSDYFAGGVVGNSEGGGGGGGGGMGVGAAGGGGNSANPGTNGAAASANTCGGGGGGGYASGVGNGGNGGNGGSGMIRVFW